MPVRCNGLRRITPQAICRRREFANRPKQLPAQRQLKLLLMFRAATVEVVSAVAVAVAFESAFEAAFDVNPR
jgi:hypothetical protein